MHTIKSILKLISIVSVFGMFGMFTVQSYNNIATDSDQLFIFIGWLILDLGLALTIYDLWNNWSTFDSNVQVVLRDTEFTTEEKYLQLRALLIKYLNLK